MKELAGLKWNVTPELLELAKENPMLPIFAEVYYEVVADDGYNDWVGEITSARIDSICNGRYRTWTLSDAEDDREAFVEENAPEELLKEWESMDSAEYDKEVGKWIDQRHWLKCIVVHIDLPDDLPSTDW